MSIKLKGSTDGSVTLQAPADTSPTGTDKTFTLPTADGTSGQVLSTNGSGALSFVDKFKLEWDQFQLTANHTSDGTMTNWARSSYSGFGQVGSQMSVSSGIFTFPSTGYYLVIARPIADANGSDTVVMQTQTTTDNSTYTTSGYTSDGNNGSGTRHASSAGFTFVDVTDVSNVKVKFNGISLSSGSAFQGSTTSTSPFTQVTFVRLGDT